MLLLELFETSEYLNTIIAEYSNNTDRNGLCTCSAKSSTTKSKYKWHLLLLARLNNTIECFV